MTSRSPISSRTRSGRSLDELPPQTRRLLKLIDRFVAEQCAAQQICRAQHRFSRRMLREAIGWGDTQLRVHLTAWSSSSTCWRGGKAQAASSSTSSCTS